MVAPKSFEWHFGAVAVATEEKVFLVGQNEDFVEQDPDDDPVSYVLRWDGEWSSKPVPTVATSVCHLVEPEPTALFLGQNGVVIRLSPSIAFVPELIDDSAEGPQHWGDMREIRTISGAAYACGMGRTVYRNAGTGMWDRLDKGIRLASGDDADLGLNSIHGFSHDDLYAVGWDGEIWRRDVKGWVACVSSTNLAMFRVVCASAGEVFACGQEGLILRGRGSTWAEMHLPDSDADVTGATEFQGAMYFATTEALYRLDDAGLAAVDVTGGRKKIKTKPGESFGALDSSNDVIWSVGPKMAIYSTDGRVWTETSY